MVFITQVLLLVLASVICYVVLDNIKVVVGATAFLLVFLAVIAILCVVLPVAILFSILWPGDTSSCPKHKFNAL